MAQKVGMGVIVGIGAGFGLLFVSKVVARMGDAAFAIDGGGGALPYHASALAILVCALIAFAVGAIKLFNSLTKSPTPVTPGVARVAPAARTAGASSIPAASSEAAPSDFDPDAALAHYLANRAATPATVDAASPVTQPRRAAGFGRKMG